MVDQDDVSIEDLYKVVSSPDQYDEFMTALQAKLDAISAVNLTTRSSVARAHWQRAASLLDVTTPWRHDQDEALQKHLSKKMQAMIAVDKDGHVADANMSARVLYDLVPESTISNLPLSDAEHAILIQYIRNITTGKSPRNAPNNVLRFQNSATQQPLLITLDTYQIKPDDPSLAIVQTNDIGWPGHLDPILQDLFNLTAAELDVVRMMVEGRRVNDIAKLRMSTPTTVRSQLRAIFAKTDTSSQMEIVRMVFGLSLMHGSDEGEQVAGQIQASREVTHYPLESQRSMYKLKNGRQIEYAIFGTKTKTGNKRPDTILFYHCQVFGDIWFKETVDAAIRANMQIVAPLRPGFGRTSIYEGASSDPYSFALEMEELLDHLRIDKAALMTVSSGLVHGLAAAQLMPDRFTSITASHPLLPVLGDEDLEGTNGYNRLIPQTRLRFPQALRFMGKAGFAFVKTKGPEAFAKAVTRASAKDVEWVSRPNILPIIVEGLYVHQENGYIGNYGDISFAEDWRPLLIDCPVPVRLVIGEHDRNVQWNAARKWAGELPHVALEILPNCGYLAHHQQGPVFLKWLKSDLNM